MLEALRYPAILLSAVLIAMLATPLMRVAARRFGVVDAPNARKIHSNPVPLLGGAAMWLGFVLTLLLFDLQPFVKEFGAIVLGATVASLVGLWDDRWGMKPLVKLIGQLVAAALLAGFGTTIHFLGNPLLNFAATVFWVVAITNALNLLDNMDGLAGGVAAWAGFFFFLLALMTGQYLVAPLALAICGACVGFLYYNFRPGHIFMGDTGALFLGFMLAAVGIKLRFPVLYDPISGVPMNHESVTWVIPLLVLGIPLFDTTLVTISRLRRRIPITRGGKDHLSHRLVALGLSRREAVLVIYLACCLLGIAAIVVMNVPPATAWFIIGAVALAGLVALVMLEQLPLKDTNPLVVEHGEQKPRGIGAG